MHCKSRPLSFCRSRDFHSSAGVTDLGRFVAISRMRSGGMENLFPDDFASLKANSAVLSVRSSMSAPMALARRARVSAGWVECAQNSLYQLKNRTVSRSPPSGCHVN